jgi:hypothetical protein
MSRRDESVWDGIKSRLTPTKIILTLLGMGGMAVLTGVAQPVLSWVTENSSSLRDDWTCGGRAAMAEGDRLSELAGKEPARAQRYLTEANAHYLKAYGCGFPDAGIRLAVSHCMGLGTPKNSLKARQIVLEIEAKYEAKRGRAGDVRKLCGF